MRVFRTGRPAACPLAKSFSEKKYLSSALGVVVTDVLRPEVLTAPAPCPQLVPIAGGRQVGRVGVDGSGTPARPPLDSSEPEQQGTPEKERKNTITNRVRVSG